MTTPLLIIDLQILYVKEGSACIPNIVDEIRLARQRGAKVFVVEFTNAYEVANPTRTEILEALAGYDHNTVFIGKTSQDGSFEVNAVVAEKFPEVKKFRAVGAYLEHCVHDTIINLARMQYEIEVVRDGMHSCMCDPAGDHNKWHEILQTPNIRELRNHVRGR